MFLKELAESEMWNPTSFIELCLPDYGRYGPKKHKISKFCFVFVSWLVGKGRVGGVVFICFQTVTPACLNCLNFYFNSTFF